MAERRRFAKKYCKYSAMKLEGIDYKDLDTLKFGVSERFKIMPRIKINEETNTVEEHFFVSFETSFLEGLELEASLFLGYISSKDDFLKLKQLITQSTFYVLY